MRLSSESSSDLSADGPRKTARRGSPDPESVRDPGHVAVEPPDHSRARAWGCGDPDRDGTSSDVRPWVRQRVHGTLDKDLIVVAEVIIIATHCHHKFAIRRVHAAPNALGTATHERDVALRAPSAF